MKNKLLIAAMLAVPSVAFAQETSAFSASQVEAGRGLYAQQCAACHGEALLGFGHAPALKGDVFTDAHGGDTFGQLASYIREYMPLGAGNTLSEDEAIALTSFILNSNGAGAGSEDYTGENGQADLVVTDILAMVGDAGAAATLEETAAPAVNNDEVGSTTSYKPIEEWTSVDADRIRNPQDGDWVSYRRNLDVQNDSPLADINVDNVANLRHEWAWSSNDDFNFEVVPVVANGVMFINEHAVGVGRVIALDATNGDEYWVYERAYPEGVTNRYTRGVALYEDMVIWASADGVVVALDAGTGEEIWETTALDYRERLDGSFGAPPVIVNDLAIVGNSMGDQGGRGRVMAFDVHTGDLVWNTFMTPEPGEPGSETWGTAHPTGAAPWLPASFDEENGLLYYGVGQPSPWGPFVRGAGNDYDPYADGALYSNNIVALDVETGDIVWNFPVMPGEFWDFDTPFETLLFNDEVDGVERQLLYQTNKGGWAVVLDRVTGEFVNAYPIAESNIVDHYEEDGTLVYNADLIPTLESIEAGQQYEVCPYLNGGRSTGAHAYSDRTGLVYVAATDYCMDLSYTLTGTGISYNGKLAPEHDYIGVIRALDPLTGEVAWEFVPESGAAIIGGTLSTGGGLVFAGTADRWFFALDEQTGELLWQTRLNGDVGQPITYTAGGRQYVAVVGGANFWGTVFTNPMLGLANPEATGIVWSFALPEQD